MDPHLQLACPPGSLNAKPPIGRFVGFPGQDSQDGRFVIGWPCPVQAVMAELTPAEILSKLAAVQSASVIAARLANGCTGLASAIENAAHQPNPSARHRQAAQVMGRDLPPCSPDRIAIKSASSKFKALIRKTAARTEHALWRQADTVCNIFRRHISETAWSPQALDQIGRDRFQTPAIKQFLNVPGHIAPVSALRIWATDTPVLNAQPTKAPGSEALLPPRIATGIPCL